MREKKKSLKLRKFKVANLHAVGVKGGNSFPCILTEPSGVSASLDCTDDCCTRQDSNCSLGEFLSNENETCDLGAPSKYC